MVDETVLGRVLAGLQGSEQGLLRPQDLHGGGRVLGQVHQGACRTKMGQKYQTQGEILNFIAQG